MAKGRVDSVYDLEAITKEQEKVLTMLEAVIAKQESVNKSKKGAVGSSGGGDEKAQVIALDVAYTKLTQKKKELTDQELRTLEASKAKARQDKVNRDATNELLSLHDRAIAKEKQLANEYRETARAQGESSEAAKKALKAHQDLHAANVNIEQSMKSFKDNVGNYTSAFDKIKGAWAGIAIAWGAAVMVAGKLTHAFGEMVDNAMKEESANRRMLFALNNNTEAYERMAKFKERLFKTTTVGKDDINSMISYGLSVGRTEAETRKMAEAAIVLSKVTGGQMDTTAAMTALQGSYAGQLKALKKYTGDLTAEQLANGAAADVLIEKYGRYLTSGMDSTNGRIITAKKSIEELGETIGMKLLPVIGEWARLFNNVMGGGNVEAKEIETAKKVVDIWQKALDNAKGSDDYALKMLNKAKLHYEILVRQDQVNKKIEDSRATIASLKESNATGGANKKFVADPVADDKLASEVMKSAADAEKERLKNLVFTNEELQRMYALLSAIGMVSDPNKTSITKLTPKTGNKGGAAQVKNASRPIYGAGNATPSEKWGGDEKKGPSAAELEVQAEAAAWGQKFQMAQEFTQKINGLVEASFSNRFAQLDKEAQKDADNKEKELNAAGGNKRKIEEINKKYAAKDKEREKERRRVEVEQAKYKKASGIASALINTAVAVTGMIANPGGVLGVVLAILAGLMGAAEVAMIASTPLPSYAKGRRGGKAELANVGEQGVEKIITRDGSEYFTPGTSTLAYLPEGATVVPNHDLIAQNRLAAFEHSSYSGSLLDYQMWSTNTRIDQTNQRLDILAHVIKNKREAHISFDKRGFSTAVKAGNTWTEYVNNNVRL